MNKLVDLLVNTLLDLKLIDEEKKENYQYAVEFFIIKVLGILVISTIGILTKKYLETIVFYGAFSTLRAYTNGYHSKAYKLCLLESAIVYVLICTIISKIAIQFLNILHLISMFAMLIIYVLSPVNTEEICLSDDEVKEHQLIIKYILILYCIILFFFINFKVKHEVVAFFEIAIILDMLLVLIGKMIVYKKVRGKK